MSPFRGLTWNEAVQQTFKKRKDEEELEAKMKEHDYLECYCHALKDPPWGGYSVEEQILHEIKQRKKSVNQGKRQTTGTSSYTYLKKDQEAVLGEAAILQTTTNLQPGGFSKHTTAQLEFVSISKVAKAHAPPTRLGDLPDEILCKIISNLEFPELGTLSEASRRFTVLIGPVPCGDAFVWARHRCLVHGHTRRASLCGDCIAALIARNGRSICKQDHASWGNTRQERVTVDARPRYRELVVPY